MDIKLKRVYDKPDASDGIRILVDRLWPRGLTKEKAKIDIWAKEVAPSNELRKWFHHEVGNWDEFIKRYHKELAANNSAVVELKKKIGQHSVTFVFGAKDTVHNNASVLRDYLLT